MCEEEPLRAGRVERRLGLVGCEVSARPALGVRLEQCRLAEEEVGVARELRQLITRTAVPEYAIVFPLHETRKP